MYICTLFQIMSEMNIFNFTKSSPDDDENACIAHFKVQREQKGSGRIKKCGDKDFVWFKNMLSYECMRC